MERTTGILVVAACAALGACSGGGPGGSSGGDGGLGGTPLPTAPAGLCTPAGFCWVNPLPQGNDLRGVHGAAANDVWAVGSGGTLLHYDGTVWSAEDSGTSAALDAVRAVSTTDAWATGDGVATHFDGTEWISAAVTRAYSNERMHRIWYEAGGDVWAAGNAGGIYRRSGGAWTVPYKYPVGWYGLWSAGASSSVNIAGGGGYFGSCSGSTCGSGQLGSTIWYALWGTASNDLWLGGMHDVYRYQGYGGTGALVPVLNVGGEISQITGTGPGDVWTLTKPFLGAGSAWLWNGATWKETSVLARSIWGGGSAAWAVGDAGRMSRWDGSNWVQYGAGTDAFSVGSVWASGADDVWVTGADPNQTYGDPPKRALLWRYDGSTWRSLDAVGLTGASTAVWGSGPSDVWVAGSQLHHWDGSRWTVSSQLGGATSIRTAGPGAAWIVGSGGYLAYAAGGTVVDRSPPDMVVSGVWPVSATEAWAVGYLPYPTFHGALARWKDGVWEPVIDLGTSRYLRGAWGSGPDDVWFVGEGGLVRHWRGDVLGLESVDLGTWTDLNAIHGTAPGMFETVDRNGGLWAHSESGYSQSFTGASRELLTIVSAGGKTWVGGAAGTLLER